jgi:hypothetical protein
MGKRRDRILGSVASHLRNVVTLLETPSKKNSVSLIIYYALAEFFGYEYCMFEMTCLQFHCHIQALHIILIYTCANINICRVQFVPFRVSQDMSC